MTMSANFHRITRVESKGRDGTHWLHIEDGRGNHIALHMEAHEAEALADAWAEAQREPEPLDAETEARGRKERLRGVRVRPLVWYNQPEGQDVRIGRCGQIAYAVGFKLGAWGYQRHGDSGHTISRPGGVSFKDERDAIDGADEDHERRILEALIDAGRGNLIGGAA